MQKMCRVLKVPQEYRCDLKEICEITIIILIFHHTFVVAMYILQSIIDVIFKDFSHWSFPVRLQHLEY